MINWFKKLFKKNENKEEVDYTYKWETRGYFKRNEIMESSGIYGIRNKITDKWYIGRSANIMKRFNSHIWNLNHEGKQKNKKFYVELKKLNTKVTDLEFYIFSTINSKNEEQEYILKYDAIESGYNAVDAFYVPNRRR